jgi:hypothetical protein
MAQEQFSGKLSMVVRSVLQSFIARVMTIGHFQKEK